MKTKRKDLGDFLRLLGLLSTVLFISHCGNDTSVQPTFTSLQTNLFSGCANSGCHTSSSVVYNRVQLNMATDKNGMYSALTSTSISHISNPNCSPYPIVKAGDYANSMVAAMAGSDADRATYAASHNGCSPTRFSDMPQPISASVQSALQTWINQGASNN